MVSIYTPRILALILLLIGTLISGTMPIILIRQLRKGHQPIGADGYVSISRRNKIMLSFLVCFGGGVLFATCFVHLLPEVRESLEHIEKKNNTRNGDESKHSHQVPMAELLVCGGFFAVYLIEELLHAAIHHVHTRKSTISEEISHGHSHSPAVLTCSSRDKEVKQTEFTKTKAKTDGTEQDYGSTTVILPAQNQLKGSDTKDHADLHVPDPEVPLSIKGLLIVVALSFHSVFEGLAIGLQTKSADVWTLFTAVALHKFVIAFAVGLEVYIKGSRVLVVLIYMIVFSCMSPLGILIGLGTESAASGNSSVVVAYLTSLATGTLMYVTFFEVLQSEKNNDTPGLLQLLAILLGFGLMTMLTLYDSL